MSQDTADESGATLILQERDFDEDVRMRVDAMKAGEIILDESEDEAFRVLCEGLPRAVAQRLRRMTPSNFVIAELQMKFNIRGGIPPITIGGECVVKFIPK